MKRGTRKILSQMLALLLAFVMVLPNVQQIIVLAQNAGQQCIYEQDGYTISYVVQNQWEDGMQAEVIITNTSAETIHNWGISYLLTGTIQNIWNATVVSHEEGKVHIQNNDYNGDIPAGQSVSFGYVLAGTELKKPDGFLLTQEKEIVAEGYEIKYNIDNDWTTGFQGTMEIWNHTEEPKRCWELSFHSNVEIDNLWGASYDENEGNYTLSSYEWNSVIPANGKVTIGFTGTKEADEEVVIDEYQLTEVAAYKKGGLEQEPITPTPGNADTDYALDTDGDGLPDYLEKESGTDCNNPDTDGDGLTDGYELFYLGTNPVLADSDKNGIPDGQEDSDGDGLSNMEEYGLGTDLLAADSDQDGLNDYEEIYVYGTDPKLADTDGDGIPDGEEVLLGLNPKGLYTNGVLDTQVVVSQRVSSDSESLKDINLKCEQFQLALEIECSGYAESNLTVHESPYAKVMDNRAIVGVCPDIRLEDKFIFQSMELQFYIDENVIDNQLNTYSNVTEELDGVNRYNVFQYVEDIDMLLPVPTTFDEEKGMVCANVNEQGTYCVMDLEAWLTELGFVYEESVRDEKLEIDEEAGIMLSSEPVMSTFMLADERQDNEDGYSGDFESLYNNILEQRKEMGESGYPISLFAMNSPAALSGDGEKRVYQSGDIVFILQGYGTDAVLFDFEKEAILQYGRMAYHLVPDARIRVLCTRSNGREIDTLWLNSYAEFEEQLAGMNYQNVYSRDYYMSRCLDKAMNFSDYREDVLPFIIWVINGEVCYNTSYEYYSPEQLLYEDRVASGMMGSLGMENGTYYTVYLDLHGDMEELVNYCLNPMALAKSGVQCMYDQLYERINNQKLIVTQSGLKRLPIDFGKISRFSKRDYDEDGLLDCEEIDFEGWQIVLEDTDIVDLPTYSQCMEKYMPHYSLAERFQGGGSAAFAQSLARFFGKVKVLPIKSSPVDVDSDGDGVEDYWDLSPMEKMDICFQVIEDYESYDVLNTIPTIKLEEAAEQDKLYGSKKLDSETIKVRIKDYCVIVVGGKTPLCGIVYPIYNDQDNTEEKMVSYKEAAENMEHYLSNTGTSRCMDNYWKAVAYTRTQRYYYYKYMNQYMDMVEATIQSGKIYTFATNPTCTLLVPMSELKEMASEANWWLAVGDAHNTIISEVSCQEGEDGKEYCAKVRFSVVDYYDWAGNDPDFYNMHLEGLAKNYFAYGIYETTIYWNENCRFPSCKVEDINLEQVSFDGIVDTELPQKFEDAKKYYDQYGDFIETAFGNGVFWRFFK